MYVSIVIGQEGTSTDGGRTHQLGLWGSSGQESLHPQRLLVLRGSECEAAKSL